MKGDGGRVGLAVAPDLDPRLSPPGREGWSERLTASVELTTPGAVDATLAELVRHAWALS